MNHQSLGTACALVAAFGVGCAPGADVGDFEAHVSEMWGVMCEHTFDCCTPEEIVARRWSPEAPPADLEACLGLPPSLDPSETDEAIRAGRMGFDPDAARDCVDNFRRLDCSTWANRTLLDPIDRCGEVLIGLVEPGGACRSGLECADHGWCQIAFGDTVGVCEAERAAGEPCQRHGSTCPPGLTCLDDGSGTTVCAPRRDVGEPCEDLFDCDSFRCGEAGCEERPPPTLTCGG